ncbi:MAG: hypothetical protein KJ566_00920 [Nanoarchaeota archaeon]|nr:hypothetical protein [Nanoarchaeota archaeon]
MGNITQGFGYWELWSEEGFEDRCFGIVDLDKMLFYETDKDGNKTSNTMNLQKLKRWERTNEKELD